MKAGHVANSFLFCDHRPHLHKHTKRAVPLITARDRYLRLHSTLTLATSRVPLGDVCGSGGGGGGGGSHCKCLHSTWRQEMGVSTTQASISKMLSSVILHISSGTLASSFLLLCVWDFSVYLCVSFEYLQLVLIYHTLSRCEAEVGQARMI